MALYCVICRNLRVFQCKFYSQKICLCKKNDKYEVCLGGSSQGTLCFMIPGPRPVTTIRVGGPRIKPSEEPKQREGKRFMMMMIWGLWWWWWWWYEGDKKKNRAMLLTSWTAALFCSLPQVEIKFNAMFSKFENLELSDWVWIYWSIYASEKRKNSQNQQQILWNYDQVGE